MLKEFLELLDTWVKINFLKITFKTENIISVTGFEGDFLLVEPKEDILLDEDCCLILYQEEIDEIENDKVKHLLFEFGGRFYYTKPIEFKNRFNQVGYEAHFNDFKYIGENICEYDNIIPFVHLGVHDEYELLNGSQMAKDWVKKAVFLKHKAIGLSDRNTLGGTLAFQTEVKKAGLRSILGMTASVAMDYDISKDVQTTYDLKLYVVNETGWQNLFQINKAINVDFSKFIPETVLLNHAEGLIAVFTPNYALGAMNSLKAVKSIVDKYKARFDDVYYQIDSVEYDGDASDIKHLNQIKTYLDDYRDLIKPILINDSYYMDQEMFQLKEYLNKIDHKAYEYSEDQYFKTLDDTNERMSPLFSDTDTWLELFSEMCNNTVELAEQCKYEIKTGESKLPKYEFAPDGMTNEEYYYDLIAKGFEQKVVNKGLDIDLYLQRIQTENDVIVPAGFVDYFLILADIVNWCKKKDIEVGVGRGSVGGALTAFLLDLTNVDPIKNDLLFERFLNPTRVLPETFYNIRLKDGNIKKLKEGEKFNDIKAEELIEGGDIKSIKITKEMRKDSMPDIDQDLESAHRNSVKGYVSKHFGEDYVCAVGAYGRLKLKAGLKDFARAKGLDFSFVNTITKDIKQKLFYTWRDFVQFAITSKIKKQNKEERVGLYDFMQKYPDVALCIKYSLNQARSASVHASAVVIVPKKDKQGNDKDVYSWMPTRIIESSEGEKVLITEWEGVYCDKAGFLKLDLLALTQLDKFKMIKALIKRNQGINIVLEDIPLDDKETFKLFKRGMNEDVFQFGSAGLKSYSIHVKPDTLEDLTAMNALYRPGPMSSNAHTDFGFIKHGKKKPEYDYGLREVTEKTYGLWVFQEEIMQALVVLGGFSLADAENSRTKIKKFDHKGMMEDKDRFILGALERGCPEDEAPKIWEKLVAFSKYGFNKCISSNNKLLSVDNREMKFSDLIVGTELLSVVENTGEKVINTIKEIHNNGKKQVYKFYLDNSNEFVECTMDHRFLVKGGRYLTIAKIIENEEEMVKK